MPSFIAHLAQQDPPESHNFEFLAYFRVLGQMLPRIRFAAYASEFGESFRKVSPKIVKPLYGLSFGYVGLDILAKTGMHLSDKTKTGMHLDQPDQIPYMKTYQFADSTVWHGTASFLLPSVAVHQTVHRSTQVCRYLKAGFKTTRILPVALGLGMIPFIIHPIDQAVDYVFDQWIRSKYPKDVQEKLYR